MSLAEELANKYGMPYFQDYDGILLSEEQAVAAIREAIERCAQEADNKGCPECAADIRALL